MDAVALIQKLHQHRSWVNEKLLAICEPLTDGQLRQLFQIGQGSIWKSRNRSRAVTRKLGIDLDMKGRFLA